MCKHRNLSKNLLLKMHINAYQNQKLERIINEEVYPYLTYHQHFFCKNYWNTFFHKFEN
jgi:hypothetical protein